MIEVAAEHIQYGANGKTILHDISLSIQEGEIFALLGHNGSGKTSMIEVLTDTAKSYSGGVVFEEEKSFDEIKKEAGILWDNLNIFPLLKVGEVINYVSNIYELDYKDFEQIYDHLELKTIENRFMKKLSRGEKKRVQILLATMHNPRLLILDEPTSELDPLIREKVWHNIFIKNRTILFTTHQWGEAQKYASSIAFIYEGEVLNTPASYDALAESFPFTNKIITTYDFNLEVWDDVFVYRNDNEKQVLVPDADHPFINHVRKKTVNYSIMSVELEDIYRYLIKEQE